MARTKKTNAKKTNAKKISRTKTKNKRQPKIEKAKKKGKEGFLKKNLRLSFSYIKESERAIYFALFLFVVATLLGYFHFQSYLFEDAIERFLKQLIERTSNMSSIGLTLFILDNNIKNAFIGLISGGVFGVFPFMTLIINGYFLGYVSFYAVELSGAEVLFKLLPHGIFELPALFIALGLGMRFGMFLFAKNIKKEFFYRLDRSLRVFIFVILPLLLIAGVIEGLLISLLS